MKKINVHIPVEGDALGVCKEINHRIGSVTPSVIRFDADSLMIVHVTLAMGVLRNQGDFSLLVDRVGAIASKVVPFVMEVSERPYIEKAKNRYVFWDLAPNANFLLLRKEVTESVGDILVSASEVIDDTPHITLGHVESARDKVESLLRSFEGGVTILGGSVGISDVGPKGTCVGEICRFAFPQI